MTKKTNTVALATADTDLGNVPANGAAKHAREMANEMGKAVTIRHAVTDKVLRTVKPTNGKAAKAAKGKTKSKAAKPAAKTKTTAKAKGERKPSGRVAEILKLASRPNGVSPAELNALTKWKGAPWKWLFKNPKGNGYCDRWGYTFKVIEGKDGGVRYSVKAR